MLFAVLAASSVLAGAADRETVFGGEWWTDTGRPAGPLPGHPNVRVDKNCYFPTDFVTITLRNVGGGNLVYDYVPDFEVQSPVHGTVRMILAPWFPADVILNPGDSISWTWDQFWQAEDANGTRIHIGELVPEGEYTARVNVLVNTTVETLGLAAFVIGACDIQVSAGEDVLVDEGVPFRLAPSIGVGGAANLTSVTWDLDPAVDGNGDGNPTNDADVAGEKPELAFGDDGVYPVTLNVRGFLPNETVRSNQDVVFTIDSSGSMSWNDLTDERKTAAKAYVDLLVPYDRAAVVDFDTVGTLVNDHHLTTNYDRVKQDIDWIDSSGGTFLWTGLTTALDEIQGYGAPTHAWVIIFLTDAESITEEDDILVPEAVERAAALGVRIYTVGLNTPVDLEDLMRMIAYRTGAKFYHAPTADALLDIYLDISEEVRRNKGSFFLASDTLTVTVRNVAPSASASADVTLAGPVNLTLRVAGEKWHDVRMTLYRDGVEVGNVSVLRTPGSPDEQSATLVGVILSNDSLNVARVVYTPFDDPLNGEVYGANPGWVIVTLSNGTQIWFHHTFNVGHPDTWVWDLDLSGVAAGGGEAALATAIADPGSDDVTVSVDWGDGTSETRTYYANGVGPDPFPSPGGGPASFADLATHVYAAGGTYTVTVTLTDDDDGVTVLMLILTMG